MTAIHISSPALELRAGRQAIAHIREHGLQPKGRALIGDRQLFEVEGLEQGPDCRENAYRRPDRQLAVCQRLPTGPGCRAAQAR